MKRVITNLALAVLLMSFTPAAFTLAQGPTPQPTSEYIKDATGVITSQPTELIEVVKIFSRVLKRNYILDERLKGKVSLYLPGKMTAEETNSILDSMLALKGFTSVPISENLWKIVPSKDAIRSTIPTRTEDPSGRPTATVITRLIPLKYLNSDEVKQLLTPLVSGDGLINAYTGTNSLIIIDSEDNIARLMQIIKSIDIPSTDQEMTIVPIKHADAVDIAAKLQEILGQPGKEGGDAQGGMDLIRSRIREGMAARASSGIATSIPPGSQPAPGAAGILGTAEGATISARAKEPKIIADERTNSIIVVADDDTTVRIRALVSQLDSELDRSGRRFYVYRCQHSDAEELAEVLSALMGGESSSSSGSKTGSAATSSDPASGGLLRTGALDSASRSSSSRNRNEQQRRNPGRSRNEGAERQGVTSTSVGDEISITADPATNSLIINANRGDFLKIRELLQQLDIKRRQVLVEAMLLEVALTDSETIGMEFSASGGGADGGLFTSNTNGDLAKLLSDPTQLNSFTLAAASSGTLSLPGNITIPSQTILLNAIASNQNVNILSAPNILATDNEQAEIVVGQNVPFITSTSTTQENLNNTFNQVERQDVGITLRLTPQISSEDFVKLQIFTEVSSVVPSTVGSNLGPTTTVRTSETVVVTKDSQMVVMGGLIADAISETGSGVPYLKDIPVLGHLFREDNTNHEKRNLLIFIRPRIVRDQFDLRDVTIANRDKADETITDHDLYPRREEVLHSEDLDRVTEAVRDDVRQPGTIRGPDKSADRAAVGLNSAADNSAAEAPLQLRVAPKLPDLPASGAGKQDPASRNAPIVSAESALALSLPGRSARFIVMDMHKRKDIPAGLPFEVDGKHGRVALLLPGDSTAGAKEFFKVGQPYLYRLDDKNLQLTPIGIFESLGEALTVYPDLKIAWYTLSPYEILGLGRGPWLLKTGAG